MSTTRRADAPSRRPLRASKRAVRAVAEGLGIGKETTAFEDTLGMELVRIVKGAIENHPIILAVKGGQVIPSTRRR